MRLAPQTISENIRMKLMFVKTSDCTPLPLSPNTWEMMIAIVRLKTATRIFVPKVLRIFPNILVKSAAKVHKLQIPTHMQKKTIFAVQNR